MGWGYPVLHAKKRIHQPSPPPIYAPIFTWEYAEREEADKEAKEDEEQRVGQLTLSVLLTENWFSFPNFHIDSRIAFLIPSPNFLLILILITTK